MFVDSIETKESNTSFRKKERKSARDEERAMHTRDQKTKERKQINKMAPTVIMWKREMRVRKEIETFFRYYFLYIYRLVFVLSL